MSEIPALYARRMDLIEAIAHRRPEPDEPRPSYTDEERETLKAYSRFGGEYGRWADLELQKDRLNHPEVLGSTD